MLEIGKLHFSPRFWPINSLPTYKFVEHFLELIKFLTQVFFSDYGLYKSKIIVRMSLLFCVWADQEEEEDDEEEPVVEKEEIEESVREDKNKCSESLVSEGEAKFVDAGQKVCLQFCKL